ncbi:protein-glutamate methylesterase/protein-glutamine glutaminase [Zymobacter sp. IVIA_12111.31 C1]|uniref:protein-glutamate methylesterase/protein-glutamine glutaminase n=1 Tax=Zymobacter sp. IVIA_12111.31 C1 TaxID=3394854 RepID=UPI0039C2946E
MNLVASAASGRKKIRVLCVDDSALMRQLLTAQINEQPDMEVVGAAPDPLIAREMIKRLDPDVLTLDVEMPRMDGLDFLERLMRLRPMPVVMVSSLTQRGSEITLKALELGAVDFLPKPTVGIREGMQEYSELLAEKIRAASQARLSRPQALAHGGSQAAAPKTRTVPMISSEKLLFIGASTGGTEAILSVLRLMPRNSPGILIAQHMPPGFTRSFADRLDRLCEVTVSEATHGERILPGHAYIAPGHAHLKLAKSGANYIAHLDEGEPVNRHRPSVDVLFDSAAQFAGRNACGVILTGMGKDGAQGLLRMKQAGAYTFAQDEESCIVYGMPREAAVIGAADEIVALDDMTDAIARHFERNAHKPRI